MIVDPVGVDGDIFLKRRGEHEFGEGIFEVTLYGAFEGTRAVGDVATGRGECLEGVWREVELDFSIDESGLETGKLDFEDLSDLVWGEGIEGDDFVDAVEEFGFEQATESFLDARFALFRGEFGLLHDVASDVARHDDDGIFEIDGSSF